MVGDKPLRYADLPDVVQDFLSDPDRLESLDAFVATFGLDAGASQKLLLLADELVLRRVALEDLPKALVDRVKIVESRSIEAAGEFALTRLLPVAHLVGIDAKTVLQGWGIDRARIDGVARLSSAAPAPAAPEAPAPRTGAGFSDPVLQHRLDLIVSSYRDGVRTREQAVAVLMRSIKTGGLELKEQEAVDLLALAPVKAVEPQPVAASEATQSQEAASSPEAPRNDGGVKGADTFTKEDEAEIAAVAEQKKDAIAHPRLITDTKAAADKIVADAKLTFATGELRTRFDHIIDARLRDVRDGFETRAKLEDSAEKGGVGLSGASLVAVMEMVEEMDAMHHKALALQMAEKKEAHVAQKAERAQAAEGVAVQEAVVMAKRYAELTGKAPTELVAPVVPSRPTSAPTAEAVKLRDEKIDTSKVKAAIEAAKVSAPVVTPVMSEPSIPVTASGRPKVEDIRFERTLAGPVEELRLLTRTDFRRLSKDPRQAILKIQDKVELVGQEGYEQRIAAIRAWRDSPLSREYVAVSREALLAGTSIAQVLAGKRALGQDVLSDDELKAIVDLNGILRF